MTSTMIDGIQEAFKATITNGLKSGRLKSIMDTQGDMTLEQVVQYVLDMFVRVEPLVNTTDNFNFIIECMGKVV